jgi:hypothetical protein
VRGEISRDAERPFDVSALEWNTLKVELGLDRMQARARTAAEVEADLKVLPQEEPRTMRLWLQFAQATNQVPVMVEWFERLTKRDFLEWDEIRAFSLKLKQARRSQDRLPLLEKTVGVWFSEQDRFPQNQRPPATLLSELAELRSQFGTKQGALTVYDHLLTLEDTARGAEVSRPMLAYQRGLVLRDLDRTVEARQAFVTTRTLAPESLWARLAASAEKDLPKD